MPETAKVNGREDAPSTAEEPGIGANKVVLHPVENPSGEFKAAPPSPEGPQQLEAPKEPQPEPSKEKSAHDVADNIAHHPAEAAETEGEEGASKESDSSDPDPEHEEGYFTGWDGLDDIHELSAEEELVDEGEQGHGQPFEGAAGHHTLAEIALASGAFQTLEGSSDPGAGSSKHDELADAVQEALLSVYGETPAAAPSRRALPFSPESPASGPGWATEDNLSPQDVILNYFDYPGPAKSLSAVSNHTEARYNGETPDAFGQPPDYASPQHQPQWSRSLATRAEYDDLSAYPHSTGHEAPSSAAAERESSRLLGAAAIGLVGGIAIAASLAVFVINSGPADRAAAGAVNLTLDGGQPGYGQLIKGNELEASKPAADASPPEAAPVIAAADVPVMPGQPSPLAIEVKPEQVNDKTLISITGIPEGARLNAGIDAGGGNWLLPPRRLNGLTINVPAGSPDTVSLGVQVLDSNVRTPLSDKKQFAIRLNPAKTEPAAPMAVQVTAPAAAQPAEPAPISPPRPQPEIAALQRPQPEPAAIPETPKPAKPVPSFFSTETVPAPASGIAPQAEPRGKPASSAGAAQQAAPSRQAALQAPGAPPDGAPRTEIEDLIRNGNKRMKEGDILEARRFYQKAVALGDPEAALAMGRSYDPIYFARIDRKNAEPDAAKAFDWYRKAMNGGASQTARVRIENLKHFLNQ
jgi:hypothetical protein